MMSVDDRVNRLLPVNIASMDYPIVSVVGIYLLFVIVNLVA